MVGNPITFWLIAKRFDLVVSSKQKRRVLPYFSLQTTTKGFMASQGAQPSPENITKDLP